jgi:hypothetical protein
MKDRERKNRNPNTGKALTPKLSVVYSVYRTLKSVITHTIKRVL